MRRLLLFFIIFVRMNKGCRISLTALLGVAVFVFWMWLYPQALHYQEQNQLFLFTWDYLAGRLAVPGGLADWLSEFLVQFFYVRTAGALILALLAVLLQRAVWTAAGERRSLYAPSFIPSLLLLVHMGDVETLVSFPVALLLAVSLCPLFCRAGWHRLWLIPLGWWLVGPVIAVPVLWAAIQGRKWQDFVLLAWLAVSVCVLHRLLAGQYPLRDLVSGLNYYRRNGLTPVLQGVIPAAALLSAGLCGLRTRRPRILEAALAAALALGTWVGVACSSDKDTMETIAYDWLIRHERYAEVIGRAEKYQPRNPVSACSVNFCLFMEGQLRQRLADFYQCGTEGLVLPSIRDNLSDVTSAELLWMMGMPNITLQYCFDLQEAIPNCRKSGRFTARIAECNIVNGWYARAERYLDILSHSLFYRRWALDRKALLRDESRVAADPVYSYIRSVRFRSDFIADYDALDKMMAVLYNQNKDNFMAAEYYQAWQLLKQRRTGHE